jgi:hypothetical protein
VVFGWWLYSGKVTDLKSAVEQSDKILKEHKDSVEVSLSDLKVQFSTTIEALGQLRGELGDFQSASVEEPENKDQAFNRDQLRTDWIAIRDQLEQIAADPIIDGRRRARYARIDRRRYLDLIEALADNDALNGNADSYKKAVAIWQKYKNGRRSPTKADVQTMSELRQTVNI